VAREGLLTDLPPGWRTNTQGDLVSGADLKARPVAYKIGDGVMVSGVRTVDELRAIADFYERQECPTR
jgi:hypothetical protein